ncbi:MAG TPA: DUF58 domain-containing protein [Chloroflexota bacterium]
MHYPLLRILAQIAVYALLATIPVVWVLFTDRFRHPPSPSQYSTLFALAALAGIFLFVPSLSIVFGTALLAIGIAWLTGRVALTGVSYDRTLLPGRLFPGDGAELRIRIRNQKLLPLSWMSINDPVQFNVIRATQDLSDLLRFSGGIEVSESLGHSLVNDLAIGPFGEVERTYALTAVQRGVYTLGPAEIETGDLFGVFRHKANLGERLEVIVYPRIFRPEEIGLPFRESLGEVVARRSLYDDPTLIAGSREYRRGDPLRRVHWKATARTGELQVRFNDPSTTAKLMIVLNLNTFQHVWQGVELERMESSIDVAASLALWALQKRFVVGLRSNGVVAGAEETPRIAPSAHPKQETHLLEHLARLSFSGRYSPEEILHDETRRLAEGSSLIFVTPVITPPLIALLTSRRLVGRVSVVYCGRFAAPVVRGVPIHLVAPPSVATRAVS